MSLWHIAWVYLWNNKFTTVLTITSLALAVALISTVLTLRYETEKRFEEEGGSFDIVVGGKGSPLQLVLSTVYFMDNPNPNINIRDYKQVLNYPEVKNAYPISIGDSYNGNGTRFRIVGTIPEFFKFNPQRRYNLASTEEDYIQFAEGEAFSRPLEAVLGSWTAQVSGLKMGDTFQSVHGFTDTGSIQLEDHPEHEYKVVGILKPTESPIDRALFVSLDSIWVLHPQHDGEEVAEAHVITAEDFDAHAAEDHDHAPGDGHDHAATAPLLEGPLNLLEGRENIPALWQAASRYAEDKPITAAMVELHTSGQRFVFRQIIREETGAMAAIPIVEINTLYQTVLGTAKTILQAIGYLVVVISALTILIGLYLAIIQRRRDLAVMRALGASAYEIFSAVIIEAFWVTILGIISGWFLGKVMASIVGIFIQQKYGMTINGFSSNREEITALAIVALVGMIAGILPAYQAYRTDVARDLAEL